MATGFDELVQQLLYHVALSGTRGVGTEELARAVRAFYESRGQGRQPDQTSEEELLFSDAPPTSSTIVDDTFLDAVWDWLEKHPDIRIETGDEPRRHNQLNKGGSSENVTESSSVSKHAGQRIFTDEDRIWQAIAGHGVDYSRIPRLSFECLSVIAAHGPEGVLQPTVTQLTGQDKRSVPKRTDQLAKNGYITKEPVVGTGTRTTMLKLKKFVQETTSPSSKRVSAYPGSRQPARRFNVVYPDHWFSETIRLLKENDNIIAVDDLGIGLGIRKNESHKRYLQQRVRKLANTGCVRKIKARIEGTDGKADDGKWIRCVQLLREPVEEDRLVFIGSRNKSMKAKAKVKAKVDVDYDVEASVEADITESEDDDDGLGLPADFEDAVDGGEADVEDGDGQELLSKRIPPQWTSDTLYTNFVYNLVDSAGPEGISSMDLNALATGPLWRRPLDEIMLRLTDVWQVSQPPHLHHLTIIRDTGVGDRAAHFHFRTMPHFEKAVEMGLTEWAAVVGNPNVKMKRKGASKNSGLHPQLDLDEWGFPELDASLFADEDGRASLRECQAAALVEARKEGEEFESNDSKSTPAKITNSSLGSPDTSRKRQKRSDAGVPRPHLRKATRTSTDDEAENVNDDLDVVETSPTVEKTLEKSSAISEKVPTYNKEYVEAHSDENFYHVGRGRYKRGERMTVRTLVASARTVQKEPTYDRGFVDAHPEELFYHAGGGRYKRGEQRRKRTSDVAQLEDSGAASKVQRVSLTPSSPSLSDEMGDDTDFPPSGKGTATDGHARLSKGAHINPQGAKEMRFENHTRRGPKPKSMIAVFRSEKLVDLPWFAPNKGTKTQRLAADHETTARSFTVDISDPEVDSPRPKKKRRSASDSNSGELSGSIAHIGVNGSPLFSTPVRSNTLAESSSAPALGTTRSGRHSTSRYSTRELQDTTSSPLAISSTTPTPTVPIPISISKPTEIAMQLPKLSLHQPVPALQASNTNNTLDLPKRKRGRPSKAEVAERERLRLIQEATNTVFGATQTRASIHGHKEPEAIVRFPLPRALQVDSRDVSTQHVAANGKLSLIVRLRMKATHRSTQSTKTLDLEGMAQDFTTRRTNTEPFTKSPPEEMTASVTPLYKRDLIVKFPLPNHTLHATAKQSTLPPSTSLVAESPVGREAKLGLTIVRPYIAPAARETQEPQERIEHSSTRKQSINAQMEGAESISGLSSYDRVSGPTDGSDQLPATMDNDGNGDISTSNQSNHLDMFEDGLEQSVVPQSDNLAALDSGEVDPISFNSLSELIPTHLDDEFDYKQRDLVKAGIARGGGIIHLRRLKIVTETMRKAGGVFPGDQEMWYPFVTAWQKTYKQVPDRATVENVVNLLIKNKQLRKFAFSFTGHEGETVHRHIITEAGFDASSPKAKKVQRAMIEAWPYRYLPKQVEISKHLRESARKVPIVWPRKGSPMDKHSRDNDVTYTPTSDRKDRGSGQFDYSGSYPVVLDVTVKRTVGGLAHAKSEANPNATKSQGPRAAKEKCPPKRASGESDYSSDDSDIESCAEQIALQSTFRLQAYQHSPAAEPTSRQGNKPRRSFNPLHQKQRGPRKDTLLAWLTNPLQPFHEPTGTFATTYGTLTKRTYPAEKNLLSKEQIEILELPKNVEDILEQAQLLGNHPVDPSDSRLYQFVHDAEAVSQWEQKMVESGKVFDRPDEFIFINHGLNCPHVLGNGNVGELQVGFVEGTLKPFVVEQSRARRQKAISHFMKAMNQSTSTPQNGITHPWPSSHRSSAISLYNTNTSSPSFWLDPSLSNLPLSLDTPAPSGHTQQKSSQARISKFTNKPVRPYVYKPRDKSNAHGFVDNADNISSLADKEPDDEDLRRQKGTPTQRRRTPKFVTTFEDSKRFAIVLALVKTLCNGVNVKSPNKWHIIAHALDFKYDAETLQRVWWNRGPEADFNSTNVDKLQQELYEPFLTAYENDELPSVNFDNLENTDWPALLLWVETNILHLDKQEKVQGLMAADDSLDGQEIDTMIQAGESYPNEDPKSAETPKWSQSSAKLSLDAGTKPWQDPSLDQNCIVEKSWIRAIATTREGDYSVDLAMKKIDLLRADLVEKATQEMLQSNTLARPKKGRQGPGRNYRISKFVLSQFMRWSKPADASTFLTKVASAWQNLVKHFLEQEQYELGSDVTEVQMLVLSNMVAQGQLRPVAVLPERNDDIGAPWPRLSKWGPPDDSSHFHVPVVYKKIAAFTPEHGLQIGVPIPLHPSAILGESCLRVPLWVDINGNLLDEMWDMVLGSVLHLAVYKPGCTAKEMECAHNNKLWAWEIELVLAWMEKVDLVVRYGAGVEEEGVWKGGWRAGEWWYCAFSHDITTWQDHIDMEDTAS